MDNGDATQGHAMTPQEFAKLMGAYPQPAENPLPTYGGYMDNSPANFSFVEFNDYFGSESEYEELIDLSNEAKERYMDVVEEWEIEDFCDNYDLDYNDSNDRQRAISKYLEQVPFDRIVEALNEDDQKRYYELTRREREQMIHDAGYPEVKEAPYAGAGSLFGIKQDTGLEGFTTSELTTSSAIHGDFDQVVPFTVILTKPL